MDKRLTGPGGGVPGADPVLAFQNAIEDSGLGHTEIIPDVKLHRFQVEGDRRGTRNGWYVFHLDSVPAGIFGSWKTGESHTWCAKDRQRLGPLERHEYHQRIEEAHKARDAERARDYAKAREKALSIWRSSQPVEIHPYLTRKRVKAFGIRQYRGCLVTPLRDTQGVVHSLQFINAGGDKRFLSGGSIQGHYHAIGKYAGTLCIAEGYATAATIHQDTGHAVAVAFNAGNLKPVALALRVKFSEARIIVCADNDRFTPGNPGVTKAREAALEVKGYLVVPRFEDIGLTTITGRVAIMADRTDFNDVGKVNLEDAIEVKETDSEAIARLAALPPMEYEGRRKVEAKKLGWRVGVLDGEVERERLKRRATERAVSREEAESSVSCPELAHEDPLVLVDRAIGGLGYGGDRKLPMLLYLCCTSRLLSFNAGSMLAHGQAVGAPSSGKNFAVDTALSMLPEESYLKIDAGSPKALIYSGEDLQHRIVVFTEADSLPISEDGGKSLADGDSRSTAASALRNLASDGYLSYDIVERSEDGQFVTRHIRKPGPTLLLTTTTKAIGGQMGTRLWEIPVKETDEQIRAALSARVKLELTRQRVNPGDLVLYQSYLQSKAPWNVIVPFAAELVDGLLYTGMNPRILRDFQRILSLIKSVTILRHQSRASDGEGRLVATLEDYDAVRQVLNESYAATVNDGLTDDVRLVVGAVGEIRQEGKLTVTYDDVAKRLGWNNMRASRKARVAIEHGWLVNKQEKPRQPADLGLGIDIPESRGLPEKQKLADISPQKECYRVNASNGAGSGVNGGDNTTLTLDNGVNGGNDPDVNAQANENAALTREQHFRIGEDAPDKEGNGVSVSQGVNGEASENAHVTGAGGREVFDL